MFVNLIVVQPQVPEAEVHEEDVPEDHEERVPVQHRPVARVVPVPQVEPPAYWHPRDEAEWTQEDIDEYDGDGYPFLL